MRALCLAVVAVLSLSSTPVEARVPDAPSVRVNDVRTLDGGVVTTAAASPNAKRPPPRKRPRATPAPDQRRPARARPVNPAIVGLAAAGGAAGGAFVGTTAVALSALALFGVFGAPSLPVIITVAVIGAGFGIATPFLAALGGGAAVLAMDRRTQPEEWSRLLQCAAAGYCAGMNLVGGTLFGNVCGGLGGRPGDTGIPGPDQAAEWTAGAAIAGLLGGTVVGGLIGWSVAPTPDDPLIPITVGAVGGGVLGSAVSAGVGAAIATAIKR